MNLENFVPGLTKFAFLLANLNLDFAIENSIFCFIKDQTNLRLQSERSTSECGSFRLVSQSRFKISRSLLDRDGHLHCRMMEENYGLTFCSSAQSWAGKS